MKKQSIFWSTSSVLIVYVVLATIGITVDISLYLMIVGCTAALASWDLMLFNQGLSGNSLHKQNTPIDQYHLQSLALAVSAGLIMALTSSSINPNFPFGVIVILVLIATGFLACGMNYITKKTR